MPRKAKAHKPRPLYPSDDWEHRKAKAAAAGKPPPRGVARKRRKHAPRQSAPAAASPTPAPPAPSQDFGAFTRPRGASSKGRAAPALEDLAGQESPELAGIAGGVCSSCNAPHGDDDRHCSSCGAPLRRVCSSCDKPLRVDQTFCSSCGAAAPALVAKRSPGDLVPSPAPPAMPVEAAAEWEPDDLFWVGWGVDAALVAMDGDLLQDKDRDRINKRAAAVANKRFRIGGRWKEEISLGMAIAGALFPAAYTYFVIVPRDKRKEARAESERGGAGAELREVGGVH